MSDALIGAVVGDRYRLTGEIGVGGMATVYRGEHVLLHKPVAVKVLRAELGGEDAGVRFEHEAIASARLDHPNIVSTTDFGITAEGRMYLVMELLEGTPLSDLITAELHLGWERAVEIVRQILRGLAHAHELGVVHRDLKPSNIMILPQPGGRETAKIIDFGIAKMIGGAPPAGLPRVETEAGIVFGTADFLAPERLEGKGDADPRGDLYAVGVILYEALTGERPFHDEDPLVTVRRARLEAPRLPSSHVPGIPAAIDAVVERALAKTPDARYPSARAMLLALDPLASRPLVGLPIAPPEPSATIMVRTAPSRKLPVWAIPAAAVAVVLVAALAGRGGGPLRPAIPTAAPAASPPVDPETDLAASIKQAAEGATVEERQRAFDRLVALGYGDRVPWVPMLSRDLDQLPRCEDRREVVAKLKKIRDPSALPALQRAAERADNTCLTADARSALATMPQGKPAATSPDAPAAAAPASPPAKRKRPSSTGGHF